MDQSGIPYAIHWGKMHNLTPVLVQKMYGVNMERFVAARARIMDNATLTAFSNKAYKDWGIDGRPAGGEVLV